VLSKVPRAFRHPDGASTYILVECWLRLRAEAGQTKQGGSRKG
jgi:hypothetical protein